MSKLLKFGYGNSKLPRTTVIFDLPAGHSCPFAKLCKSSVHRVTGKLTDGPHTEFRCYAASTEGLRSRVRAARWHNFNLLKNKSYEAITDLIYSSLPEGHLYRIHSSGDFFSQEYFDAWVMIAAARSDRTFYAYTKALPFWVKRRHILPRNFKLIASVGGTHDHLIEEYKLRSARVVLSEKEAKHYGLAIDHDDTLAWKTNTSFALLIHGTQPAQSKASVAWQLVRNTVGGYSKKKLLLVNK